VFLDVGHTNLAAALLIYAVLAVSLVILVGWAGEISLGHVGFLGIGAAVSAGLNVHLRWDLTVSILAAGLVGAVAALLVGLPALKIRGIFLGVTTLAFAVLTSTYLLNRDYFGYLPDNLREPVVRFPLFGRVDISGERSFYYVCLGVLGIALWAAGGLSGRFQRVLVATRDNERTAQSFGLHSARLKLAGFAVSGFFASLAGGLLAIHQRGLGTQLYQPAESLRALTMVVVGGIGSIPGALLGTVFVKATEWFDFLVPPNYGFFFTFAGSGVGLVLVLMVVPGGLGSLLYAGRDRLLRAVARRRGIDLPEWTGTPVDAVAAPGRTVDGRSPAPAADGLLGVRALDFSYGHVQVLFGVDLDVRPGEIVALLGTNGAGKTTILRALSGISTASAGSITFEGQDITRLPPHRVAAAGIAQVPGGKAIFPSLTVAEHLRLAGWLQRGDAAATAAALDEVHGIFPVLRDKSGLQAASLSGGQQQMLGLAMAFVARPKLLVIDELSLGLAPIVVEHLLEVVRSFRDRGTTVVLVEQSVNVALTVADRAYFIEKGEVRFEGTATELLGRPDVLRSVILEGATAGSQAAAAAPSEAAGQAEPPARVSVGARRSPRTGAEVILEVSGLSKSFAGISAVNDVGLRLHDGEVLGLLGPNGAGKTTVFDLISGFLTPTAGSIVLGGTDLTGTSPHVRARMGLSRSFQDARMFPSLTVRQAIAVGLDRLTIGDPVAAALHVPDVADAEQRLAADVDDLIEVMELGDHRNKFVAELSTGTRRVVDLTCQIGIAPKVVLFDEPSSGIAQRDAEALGPVLLRIKEQLGASLVVIEHDMPLLRAVSDRVIALDLGRVIAEGTSEAVLAHPAVVASYLGGDAAAIRRSGPSEPVLDLRASALSPNGIAPSPAVEDH
jgi:ABC-type branched-subunit amino acid transport system ATPase component/ABC-type branched-subunit amino acid transport system permease subunit